MKKRPTQEEFWTPEKRLDCIDRIAHLLIKRAATLPMSKITGCVEYIAALASDDALILEHNRDSILKLIEQCPTE